MNKISLCIPTYNRWELLLESYKEVIEDERIGEVCISVDKGSKEIEDKLRTLSHPKIKIKFHEDRVGVHENKRRAIEMAENQWVILFDSDNIIKVDYLDVIYIHQWVPSIVYQPEYLYPHFDFRKFSGNTYTKENIKEYLKVPDNKISTFGNAQNFFINRDEYLRIWEKGDNVDGNDSIFFCYLWLKAGNSLYLTPNLKYFHRIHNGSNYQADKQAGRKVEEVINKLKQL